VMDYLVEEVLGQQSESVQSFLLRTSILDRVCGPLCDAVLLSPGAAGQATLERLEHANLFIVPLDDERRWYRYHHLFAELLRQRLQQSDHVAEYHIRASQWYEDNGLELEAFRHAAAANDIERAVRLMDSQAMPLHVPGAVTAILNWLESLPITVLNARPALWWKQAELLLLSGQTTRVEEKLQATEATLAAATLPSPEADDPTRDLIGKIAAVRSNVALSQQQADTILVQARRALGYLHPNNLAYRSSVTRDMGFAHYLQGNRAAAGQTFAQALSIAQASEDMVEPLLTTIGLAQILELDNQLRLAAESYQSILSKITNLSVLNAGVVYFGLARIYYEWNDLDAAEQYGEQSLRLAQQFNQIANRFIMSAVLLARLKLVRGDVNGAAALLDQSEQTARQHNLLHRLPEIAAVRVLMLLRQGHLAAAAHLAETHALPISQARVHLAQGDPSAALALLSPWRQQMEAKGWADEQLRVMVLQAVALHAQGDQDQATHVLGEALALAEPGGFVRLFVDEGRPIVELLTQAAAHGMMPDYVGKLRAAFEAEAQTSDSASDLPLARPLIEPLSQRELHVLRLIALGLSNREIGEQLFLALDTVKGHNRRIFDKLQVERRTEAAARAHELGLV
jgi:LuxR family transcriptional regulator, maltose regulon positive regulatory protein